MAKNSSRRRLAVAALVVSFSGIAAFLAVPSFGQEITPYDVDPWQHTLDCMAALISNPDLHAQFCLPSQVPIDFSDLSTAAGASTQSTVFTIISTID